ncbi:MAG: AsmA-like C-terminal region-containing protein [Mucilaginibacter sp.]|uniref:AsmA-like C-terminal region-containing protein n=1 Tax=Mucilaginibacter sp. TaxID=1882438 RepID=UPI003267482C
MPNWFKTTLKIIAALAVVIIVLLLGVLLYINSNKAKVQALVTAELNKNLDGQIIIGNMNTVFFKDFPNISLSLHNVLLRDKQWAKHHHTLLDAKDFDVSVNTASLLKGTVSINHVDISNAAIDFYTDSNGYSNTAVFKKGNKKKTGGKDDANNSATEISRFNLHTVSFAVNNQMLNKLFHFDINSLAGQMAYPDSGWHAKLHLDVDAKSMAFNTDNGSFIKGKQVEGDLVAGYNEDNGKINIQSPNFNIGGTPFKLNALFAVGKGQATFDIRLAADAITWQGASGLLAANISKKLAMFNMDKPLAVKATISGSFKGGDPYLNVEAKVRNTKLTTPGGNIDDCSFDGVFNNNFVKGQGNSDANSIIKIYHLTGNYSHLPFTIDTGSIINLEKPIATGNFRSKFPLSNLNYLMGKTTKFTRGTAEMKLRYKADIVDYRLNKPFIQGLINLRDADVSYLPRKLNLTNTSMSLNFTSTDLILNNIRLQSGKSIVMMEGRVKNFLNLYYDSPEKILLAWQINSPQLYLGEFLGFLNKGGRAAAPKSRNSGNIIDQLSNVLDRAHAEMHMQVAKLYYKKFLATNATADVLLSEDGVVVKNMSVKHAGGSLKFNGQINDGSRTNNFIMSAIVSNVDVHEFFYAFDNFGLTDITSNNLKGILSAQAQVKGGLTNNGSIVPRSINGYVTLNLKNGALINYNPLKTVGKLAFPFRDLNNIVIPNLDARFDLHGDNITINPMKLTSSIINIDIAGTYGLTRGTNIALDIPLRNPKKDSTITDKDELLKKRYKGIVLHILAKDDENGKVKIGWNKDHKKTP